MSFRLVHNRTYNYCLYRSNTILENHKYFLDSSKQAYNSIKELLNNTSGTGTDITYSYKKYNIFSITSDSIFWYRLYEELVSFIEDYLTINNTFMNQGKWMEAWINYHTEDEVLDWHDHSYSLHGYISINPESTTTLFRDYEIINEIGNIYIGPGMREHKVQVNSPLVSPRVTVGFDVALEESIKGNMINNQGLHPLLI